jgi:hypothetical protein
MGINAQTSVPNFTSGDVLTAANTNLLTNAPPVFAGTATRDAAFGGAGEKTLAEGQLCYLEDSNIVQYYDGAAWATVGPTASKIAQVIQTVVATAVTTTSSSYVTSSLNASITPTLNTSKILIVVSMPFSNDSYPTTNFTIFRGTVAGTNLAGATGFGQFKTGASTNPSLQSVFNATYLDSPATTSATTYTVGMKTDGGTVISFQNSTTGTITLFEVLV